MTSDGTNNYTYDSEGNRTRKTTISGGAYVDYVWDYHNRLTDVKSYTSGGTLTQRIHYTYDMADRVIGRQIDTNGDGTYDAAARYVNDWSTAPQTNVNHLKYDSIGNITAQSDSTKQPLFAYTGRQWDSDAKLQYTRTRWYDPKGERFISEDPSSFAEGDINLSRYVRNSPLTFIDPSGLQVEDPNEPIFKPGYDPNGEEPPYVEPT